MPSSLMEELKERIEKEGSISIADYMNLALSHPKFGYYVTRDPFGPKGDFITSPEISQMFGEMLGAWAAAVWLQIGGKADLVEFGPGRGVMMKDIIRATRNVKNMHDNITIHMVETSPVLMGLQKQNLANEPVDIVWHKSAATLPAANHLIMVANEFLDALPIYQITRRNNKLQEIAVVLEGEALKFIMRENKALEKYAPEDLREGEVDEISPEGLNIVEYLAGRISKQKGAFLIVDYGYKGKGGKSTLQAVKNHKYHDVLKDPGTADITAHVGFSKLMKAARSKGVKVSDIIAQGKFLTDMGIGLRADILKKDKEEKAVKEIDAALDRLVSASQMGELFKVMAIYSEEINIPGF